MSHRVVKGLKWVQTAEGPFGRARARGAKAKGLQYERALARALPWAQHGPWFEYEDSKGLGLCQPDFVIEEEERVIVLEAKYTWTLQGHLQIEQLYRPVLEMLLGKPVVGIEVCKVLLPEAREQGAVVFSSLADALASSPRPWRVWHWIPVTVGTRLRGESPIPVVSPEAIGL